MAKPARKKATYEDVLNAPEHHIAQIVGGKLHVHPRPAIPHAQAASVLGMDLGTPFQRGRGGPGGWWIVFEPELHLGGDILVPDLAGWRAETLPRLPNEAYFTCPPDWACEVLSPSTQNLDRIRKLPIYAAQGVGHVWLVDPNARSVEAYRNQDGQWLLVAAHEGDAEVRLEPFDAVALQLGDLWNQTPGDASEAS